MNRVSFIYIDLLIFGYILLQCIFTWSFLESLYSLMIWSIFSTIPASDTHMILMFSFTNTASILRLTRSWSKSDCCKSQIKSVNSMLKGNNSEWRCSNLYHIKSKFTSISLLRSASSLVIFFTFPFPSLSLTA